MILTALCPSPQSGPKHNEGRLSWRPLSFSLDRFLGHRAFTINRRVAPVSRPVQRTGVISSRAILGGLHHRYARV
jgi:hypothetical protein